MLEDFNAGPPVPLILTVRNLSSFISVVISRSSTRSEKAKRTTTEHGQRRGMASTTNLKTNGSKGEQVCEAMTHSNWLKKSYQCIFLALSLVIVLCICSLPSVLYFALQVGALPSEIHIHVYN